MRIIHVSYKRVANYDNPHAWLARLPFFTVLLEETAKSADVKSFHLISYTGVIRRNGVEYHFLKQSAIESLIPFRFNRRIARLAPDVVVVHGLVFPLQVIALRRQLGSHAKIALMHHSEPLLRHYKAWLQKLADRYVYAYFFNSLQHSRKWIERKLISDYSKICEVMIGSSIFHPMDRTVARSKTFVPEGEIYLWVGQLDINKDPQTLVNGFMMFAQERPNAHLFMIYQEDNRLDEIKDLISGFTRIKLVGKVNHPDLLYWYNSADFIISTSHYEGGGIAVCEAMSCGCIPLLTDISSFQMMINYESVGFLFPPGNPKALTAVLVKSAVMDVKIERQKVLGHFRDRLSNEVIVEKMMGVFKSLQSHG
jgi:glycosyltransferase involved in cell wall biosynthesis